MKAPLFGLCLVGFVALTSCGPRTPLEQNFEAITPFQDKIGVMRCSLKTHEKHLADLRKKGWRVSGESRLQSSTRLSDVELKKTAARKGARAVLVSESSVQVTVPAPSGEPVLLNPPKVAATPSLRKVPEARLSTSSQSESKSRFVNVKREKTPPLPHQEVYRVETQLTTPSSSQPKTKTQWSYRVSFLSYP